MRFRSLFAAAMIAVLQLPAAAQSPEMQDILNQVSGEFRRTQGERLSQNCDYTAIDVAKQALQRAGFTNMAAGPVVIGALEKSCKAALTLTGAGLAADAYSLSKCVYDYYTSGQDARGLVTCLGIEAAGVGVGKLLDWLDVDPVTQTFTGQVYDRIGDDLKAGGLSEAAAKLKEGEIRQFAERMAEALTQVQRTAREKAQSESPEPIVYTAFAYGCTVTIVSRFNKGQPPTKGPNSVALQISIRDCECYGRAPTVGKPMKEASIFVTVPVTFTPGPGASPAWTADLARMRTRIRSVCCDGTTSGVQPPPGGDGGAHDSGGTGTTGGTGTPQPPQPPAPPPPPPPEWKPPTIAEQCPECVPILNDIESDRAAIESAQERINRIDEELRELNSEAQAQHDEIARAQQTIKMNSKRVSLLSGGSGGMTRTQVLTPDGVKVTTTTYPDGRTETQEERTSGNRDIDAARDRITAAREKLKDIEKRREAARKRREDAAGEKAKAENQLKTDQARLEQCLEDCRKRRTQPPPPPPVLQVPGGPVQPPPQPPRQPPPPPSADPPGTPSVLPPAGHPPPRLPKCKACDEAYNRAWRAFEKWDGLDAEIGTLQWFLDDTAALAAGKPPIHLPASQWEAFQNYPLEKRNRLRSGWQDKLTTYIALLVGALEDYHAAMAALDDCNKRLCGSGTVTIGGVIGVTGTNPFNPDNPTGTTTGPQPPPPPPPPPGQRGTLQFSSASYSGTEGTTVTVFVTRANGATGPASIQYFATTRTATAGSDFVPVQGTLTWADGENATKSFQVQLVDDTEVEPTELVELTLSNPTGAAMAEPSRGTISIIDNDSAPPPPQTGSLQFSSPTYAATEGQGALQVTVTRTGNAAAAVTVQYGSFNGTAVAGSDFSAAFGTLSWAAGDTSAKTFSVAILDDSVFESSESFTLRLSNPTGGATLGSPSEATVNIADNDTQGACGPSGSQWAAAAGSYACSGNCDPCPSPQRVTVNDNRVTITPFHAGGAATFTGCGTAITSDSNTLTYFGQPNHRATVTRSGNNYMANIQSSGGGSCVMSCIRTGP